MDPGSCVPRPTLEIPSPESHVNNSVSCVLTPNIRSLVLAPLFRHVGSISVAFNCLYHFTACGLQVTGFLYLSEACEVLVTFSSTRIPEKCILRSNLIKALNNLIRSTRTRLGFEIFVKGCDSIKTTCQNVCSTVVHLKATNLVKMRSKLQCYLQSRSGCFGTLKCFSAKPIHHK